MSDLEESRARWQDWIVDACASVGVDPALVDVAAVHDLTKRIAHDFERPMAPVGAFVLGLALGRAGAGADAPALRQALDDSVARHSLART